MATADVKRRLRASPSAATAVLSVAGYALVVGTFLLDVPLYPDLSQAQVNLLSHAIAVVNTTALACLVSGWYWIRKGDVDRHRLAMISAFALILLFLVIYLVKVGGGGEKHIAGVSDPVRYAYLAMLLVHVVLSIVAVPVVLYALVLGLTHTPAELRRTAHGRVGRVAAAAWILSLALGVVTYVMLNHVYRYEFAAALVPPV